MNQLIDLEMIQDLEMIRDLEMTSRFRNDVSQKGKVKTREYQDYRHIETGTEKRACGAYCAYIWPVYVFIHLCTDVLAHEFTGISKSRLKESMKAVKTHIDAVKKGGGGYLGDTSGYMVRFSCFAEIQILFKSS
jgi:hypothetical protein